ncbi:hypothetical protein, partial [Pseudomonas sp. AU12215]|uniref:hypothetical protein n=1 Tax=Pseudomonas sp. AU12215 TaxID=1860123 RepID=UPI001C400D0C
RDALCGAEFVIGHGATPYRNGRVLHSVFAAAELKELPFPPPQIIDDQTIQDSVALQAQIRSESDLGLADTFVENVFRLIPAEGDSTAQPNASNPLAAKRGRRSRVAPSNSMADLFGGENA